MTKEQILQKHFTAQFGHDGHGEFMQYILDAMEDYAQQQVKNCSIPDVVGQSEQLKAVQKLKDFAYEVCPLHREDDLEEIVGSL
jgi:hypothetical protein